MRYLITLLFLLGMTQARAADLSLEFSILPSATLQMGEPITFRSTLTNLGPDVALNSRVLSSTFIDFPRPNASTCPYSILSARKAKGFIDAYHWRLAFGDLAPGQTETCDITVPGIQLPYEFPVQAFGITSSADPHQENNVQTVFFRYFEPHAPVPAIGFGSTIAFCMLMLATAARRFSRTTR